MKIRSVRPVGSGYQSCAYRNHEGYPDPTAGFALAGYRNRDRLDSRHRPRKKDRAIIGRINPVSEMVVDLTAIGAML